MGQETVYNYLSYLENAYVIFKVPRYDIKGKRLLEVNEKYYVGDIGLRHSLLGFRESDISGVLENFIYLELRKRGYTITIGKQQEREIDFIITKRDFKAYIQVAAYLVNEETIFREFGILKEIRDSYPKFVLTLDNIPESNNEGIRRIYLPDFLLSDNYL